MRWNCPHCDTAIQIKVDWNELEKVYAQCRLCEGISLLSLKTAPAKVAIAAPATIEEAIEEPAEEPVESFYDEETTLELTDKNSVTAPPPFRGSAAYAVPPAFLMNSESLLEIPTYFSTIEDELREDEKEIDFTASIRSIKTPRMSTQNAPVLIALLIAMVSGGYLFTQIKKILKEPGSPRVASVEKNHKR